MKIKTWVLAATLTVCGASVFTACSNSDNSTPDTTALTEWQAGKTLNDHSLTALVKRAVGHLFI